MAQRLVRVVCPKCREPYQPSQKRWTFIKSLRMNWKKANGSVVEWCNNCQHTGYRGRRAVFELMTMNSTLREMAFNSEPAQNIRRQARLFGMRTLVDDARDKAMAGLTTLAEVEKLSKGGH